MINAGSMAKQKYDFDAIVVGGGPGGSAGTAFLAKKGLRVLLVDKAKFPRDKTCGDGISGKSIKLLKELGMQKEIEKALHAKIYGVIFSSPKGELLEVPIPKNQDALEYGYGSRRMVFDDILFQNAKKHAVVWEEFEVTDLLKENGKATGIVGKDKNKKEKIVRAPVVVGADSANSVVARKAGLWKTDPKHLIVALRAYYKGVQGMKGMIELHFLKSILPGYFWIFPLEDGIANVGIGMTLEKKNKKKINLEEAMMNAISNDPMFKERFWKAEKASEIKAWNLPLATAHRPAVEEGVILIGDAASLIDPFTGEGIGNALLSGKIAAETIADCHSKKDFSKQALLPYEEKLWQGIGKEIKNSYYLQKLSNYPWLFNLIVSKANRNPKIANYIGESLVNQEARRKMESPWFFIRALLS